MYFICLLSYPSSCVDWTAGLPGKFWQACQRGNDRKASRCRCIGAGKLWAEQHCRRRGEEVRWDVYTHPGEGLRVMEHCRALIHCIRNGMVRYHFRSADYSLDEINTMICFPSWVWATFIYLFLCLASFLSACPTLDPDSGYEVSPAGVWARTKAQGRQSCSWQEESTGNASERSLFIQGRLQDRAVERERERRSRMEHSRKHNSIMVGLLFTWPDTAAKQRELKNKRGTQGRSLLFIR